MDAKETPAWWRIYGEREECCPARGPTEINVMAWPSKSGKYAYNGVTKTAARTTKGGTKVDIGGPESSRLRHLGKTKMKINFRCLFVGARSHSVVQVGLEFLILLH